MKKLTLLLTLATITQFSFGQKQRLGFNLVVGETYYHVMRSDSKVKQEIGGQENTINMSTSGKLAFNIVGLKDSVYEMSVTYQKLSMTMTSPAGNTTASSEKKEDDDIMSQILGAFVDKPFLMTMTKTGTIVGVKNLDSVFERALEKFTQLSPEQKVQLKDQLMGSYGEKALKGNFELVTAIFPYVPVERGSTWTRKTKIEAGMEVNLSTTFEFKEKGDNYNLIIGNGKFVTADNA